jgi:hypothetical protein
MSVWSSLLNGFPSFFLFPSQTCYKSQTTALLLGWLAGASSSSRETINCFSGRSYCWCYGFWLIVNSQTSLFFNVEHYLTITSLAISLSRHCLSVSFFPHLSPLKFINTRTGMGGSDWESGGGRRSGREGEFVWEVGSFGCF